MRRNNGTGFGMPAKDLSINYVPVPYPDYPPAVIEMKPEERQLWRVLNASAITYLNLAILYNRAPQPLGLVALDGVPFTQNGKAGDSVNWQTHIGVPPGGRVEFIVKGPALGVNALFVTRTVDTGPGGENDPNRAIARITASKDAAAPRSSLAAAPQSLPPSGVTWLGDVTPVRTRKLYFSEKPVDANDPKSAMEFYITVDGKTPAMFDPHSGVPDIVVKQGTVEDWIVENRSNELHAFHIHQLHFVLLDYLGKEVNEPFLRDTVNVPYYNGRALQYPSVKLRMDFRDPAIRRHVSLSLPSSGTRGRRNDGADPRGTSQRANSERGNFLEVTRNSLHGRSVAKFATNNEQNFVVHDHTQGSTNVFG